jgi:hypothetical protein
MIQCPLCGGLGMLPITPHRPGRPWTPTQVAVMRRLRALGMTAKATAKLLGDGNDPSAVHAVEHRQRQRERGALG